MLLLFGSGVPFPQRLLHFILHQFLKDAVQHLFSLMTKRRMPEIVANRGALHHLGIDDQPRMLRLVRSHLRVRPQQRARRFPGDLRHLQRMRQPRAVIIARARAEHLGFALKPAEGRGMNQPRIIAFKRRAACFLSDIIRVLPVFS